MAELKEVKTDITPSGNPVLPAPSPRKFIILSDHQLSNKEKALFPLPHLVINITKRHKLLPLELLSDYKYLVLDLTDAECQEAFNRFIKDPLYNQYCIISFTTDKEEFKHIAVQNHITRLPQTKQMLIWEFDDALLQIDFSNITTPLKKTFGCCFAS